MNNNQLIIFQQQQYIYNLLQQVSILQQQLVRIFAHSTTSQLLLQIAQQQVVQLQRELQEKEAKLDKLTQKHTESTQALEKRTLPLERKCMREMTWQGKKRRLEKIRDVFETVCSDIGQETTKISVHLEVQGLKDLSFDIRGQPAKKTPQQQKDEEDLQRLKIARKILRVKDLFRIPYKALQALRIIAGIKMIPPEKVLQAESLRLATSLQLIPIDTIPSKDGCMRQLSDVLEFLLDIPENRHLMQNERQEIEVKLRFACDGAKLTKYKDSVRAVCKLVHPTDICTTRKDSPDDEISLVVYMGKEDRANFQLATHASLDQMRQASTVGIRIQDKIVKVRWLFCSDWKAMAMVRGINQANSHYFCLWCLCTKADIANFDVETWSVQRSAEAQQASLQGRTPPHGYIARDLLDWVPYRDMLPDELHLRMRISSKLFNQVVMWSISQDRKTALKEEMKKISVDFNFVEEQGNDGKGKIKKWTQLGGDDLRKVIQKLKLINILDDGPRDIQQLQKLPLHYIRKKLQHRTGQNYQRATKDFVVQELSNLSSAEEQREILANRPQQRRMMAVGAAPEEVDTNHEERVLLPDKIQEVWDDFDDLMESVRAPPGSPHYRSAEDFMTAAKKWALKFKKYTSWQDVIPYIHVLVYHIPDAMRDHGFLPHIGISQVERKNYDQHLTYFQGTSRQGGKRKKEVTVQVLERENRLLYFRRYPGYAESNEEEEEVAAPEQDARVEEEQEEDSERSIASDSEDDEEEVGEEEERSLMDIDSDSCTDAEPEGEISSMSIDLP